MATVGIRGTHFTLVSCQDDCESADGQPTPNGLFGGVTDGRISVANASGETEFGQQDFFHVTAPNAPPQRLLAPPGVLNDRTLVVRARAGGASAAAAQADEPGTRNSGSTQVSTSPQPAELGLRPEAAQALRAALAATERLAPFAQPIPTDPKPGGSGMLTFLRSGPDGGSAAPLTEMRNFTLAQAREQLPEVAGKPFTDAASLAAQLATVRQVGSNAAAGVYWVYEAPTPGNLLGAHFVFGDTPAVALPSSGFATYAFTGGTAPTDNFGRSGALTAGRLGMDFAARQVKPLDPITLQFFASAAAPAVSYTITTGNTWSMTGGPQNLSQISCIGCNGATSGTVFGRLTGFDMRGYIAAIALTGSLGKALPHFMGAAATFGRQ
jgi:hypothetical protein